MLEVGGYDTDSITEDIDFTMKMIDHFGNSNRQFGYADDVIAYTPPVSRFSQLLKQRYRWKQGRFKALFKHRRVIFNRDAKYIFPVLSIAYQWYIKFASYQRLHAILYCWNINDVSIY